MRAFAALTIVLFVVSADASLTLAQKEYSISFPANAIQGKEVQLTLQQLRALTQKAELGDASAQYGLGVYYREHAMPKDYQRASEWFTRAAEQGDVKSMTALGALYAQGLGITNDFNKAASWCRKAADYGDPGGQFLLAKMYLRGDGVERDATKALDWALKAANQGQSDAQYLAGWIYTHGGADGVTTNYVEALKWSRKAAEQGGMLAERMTGLIYARGGYGVSANFGEAIMWFTKAADQNDAEAANNLGMIYSVGGADIEANASKAVEWYRKAADLGHVEAEYELGRRYARGDGMKKDVNTAVFWWRKAAVQGSSDAQSTLALLYEIGEEIEPDAKQAFELFQAAAKQGDTSGMAGLARAYYYGSGVERDYVEAAEWNEKAMVLGSVSAQQLLAVQYANGQGFPRDRKRALELALQAANKGSFLAMQLLSSLYGEGGDGVEIDYAKSAKWLRRSVERDSDSVSSLSSTSESTVVTPSDTNASRKISSQLATDESNSALLGRQCAVIWFASESKTFQEAAIDNDILVAARLARALGVSYSELQLRNVFKRSEHKTAGDFDTLIPEMIKNEKGERARDIYLYSYWCTASRMWVRLVPLWKEPDKQEAAREWVAAPLAKAQNVAVKYDRKIATTCQELGVKALGDPLGSFDLSDKLAKEILNMQKDFLLRYLTEAQVEMATQPFLKRTPQ